MTFAKYMDISSDLANIVKGERDKLFLKIDARVVLETPVLTGRARGNFQVGDDTSPSGTLPEPVNPNAGAQRSLNEGKTEIKKAKPYTELYLNNNLPYIEKLNEGGSPQAEEEYIDRIIEQEVGRG